MPTATPGTTDGVTIVIPTQNRAQLLVQTLRSVDEQSLRAKAVIVADDGSTDATEQVALAAGARYIRNDNGDWGPAGARNAGMRAAATEYVSFIDSDDLLHPRALRRLREALDGQPQALFSFGCALAARRTPAGWQSEGLLGPRPWELDDFLCSLYARNSIPSGGTLVRRRPALELGASTSVCCSPRITRSGSGWRARPSRRTYPMSSTFTVAIRATACRLQPPLPTIR